MSDDRQPKVKRFIPPAGGATAEIPPPVVVEALPAPVRQEVKSGADKAFSAYRAALDTFGQSQRAVAADMTEMALALGGLARGNLTETGDSVTALFRARSLTEAVEIQLGFARRSLDALAAGSTRLGEIGLRLASDAAKPMLGRFVAG